MDKNFGLLFSFGIDNDELEGVSNVQAFVLGFELAEVFRQCRKPSGFTRVVHAENRDRVRRACEHFERTYSLSWCENDPGEEWLSLQVAPKE